jgi:hypothetical protein
MLPNFLHQLNRLVSNVTLIVTFSLWAYLMIRSWGGAVARALMIMLFGVFTAVAADVLIQVAHDVVILEILLRWSWLGIMLVPTSMLHMVMVLAIQLQIVKPRMWMVWLSYVIGMLIVLGAVATDLVVATPIRSSSVPWSDAATIF